MNINKKHIEKTFTKQLDQSDCGVACLASVIKYYGGSASLEQLREESGTTKHGTTLLGLYQACPALHLKAEAMEAEGVHNLSEVEFPVLLHVVIDEKLQHYVVCYGQVAKASSGEGDNYIIGDPGKGIVHYTKAELEKIWQSKTLLTLQPTKNFVKTEKIKADKRTWLKNLVEEDLPLLLIALVIGVIITVLAMTTAIFSQRLIDDILPAKDGPRLLLGLGSLVILLLARSCMSYIRNLFLIRQSKELNIRMIKGFYNALLYLPKSFFDSRKTGELMARMNDTRRIQSAISYVAGNVVIDGLIIIVSLVFVHVYAWQVGLVVLGTLPFYALIIWRFNSKIIRGQKEVMQHHAYNESNYIDTIQGIATIKAMNKQPLFSTITQKIYAGFQQKIFNLGKVGISYSWVSEVTGVLVLASVFGYASYLVLQNVLQLGEMVAVLSMAGGIMPAVTRLAAANIQIKEATVAFNRMYEFASIPPEFSQEQEVTHGVTQSHSESETGFKFESLAVNNLSFRFKGRKRLLHNIHFTLKKGEMIALLGESGCGKSTLLQILQKFYPPEEGEIIVNGTSSWESISHINWRSILGVVPQDIKIFSGTLLDNICLGVVSKEANNIVSFCKTHGFSTYFEQFPQSYYTLLGEEGLNLSGGQKQLVALVRALYQNPQLLLLDEPTAAMDRNMEEFVLNLLQKLSIQMGIILVTHRPKPANRADRIYVIENGKLITDGTPQELRLTQNLFSESLELV